MTKINKNKQNKRSMNRNSLSTITYLSETEGLLSMGKKVVPIRGPVKPIRELKYVDISVAAYQCDTTGSVTPLNLIAEGSDNTMRTGRQVCMRSVELSGYLAVNSAGTLQSARCLIIWDNASNGVVPTTAQIMNSTNSFGFHNVDFESRFTVLYDKAFALFTVAGWNDSYNIQVGIPLKAITQFIGTAAIQANLTNGGLYLVTLGSNVPGTTASALTVATRCRYTDED